jgi:hypothetical protein
MVLGCSRALQREFNHCTEKKYVVTIFILLHLHCSQQIHEAWSGTSGYLNLQMFVDSLNENMDKGVLLCGYGCVFSGDELL